MNRLIKFTAAAILSSMVFAGASQADGLNMESSPAIDRTLRSFRGNDFDISYVHNWKHFSDRKTGPISVPQRSPSAIRRIQASINSNRHLVKALQAQGVDVRTIVNADQAADGGITFYIR